ncbi:MAG: ATP-binding protein [Planctomycetaceae bacterium]
MKRLFLKITLAFLLILVAARWVFFVAMDLQFYSDRERIVSGLCTLQLGSLRMAAEELRGRTPDDRGRHLQEWQMLARSPIRLMQMSDFSEADRQKMLAPDGYLDKYQTGILDQLTVAIDADSCLQMGPLADSTERFIEEEVRGLMSLLRTRIAAGQLAAADLEGVSETLEVPVKICQRHELPADIALPTADSGAVVLFHKGKESFVAAAFQDSDRVLCAGPLVRVRVTAERTSRTILLVVSMFQVSVAGVIVTVLWRRFRRIENAAATIAAGDFSVRLKEQEAGEAGSLAKVFNRMAANAENEIRQRRELLNMISHELRTPVARLRFAVEMLGNPDSSLRDSKISVIRHSLDDLEKITLEALEYVQLDGRQQQSTPEWVDARDVISQLLDTIRVECPHLKVRFCTDAAEHGSLVFADPAGFYRVIANLTANAQRFARTTLTVRVVRGAFSGTAQSDAQETSVQPSTHGTWLIVDDDGPGIPDHQRATVLQPFVRVRTSHSEADTAGLDQKFPHVGLGLAISRAILEQHQGLLEIETNAEGGCRIRSWWPEPAAE